MSKSRHRQDVRDEVPRQETDQDEAGRDTRSERKDNALSSQYRSEYISLSGIIIFFSVSEIIRFFKRTFDVHQLVAFFATS